MNGWMIFLKESGRPKKIHETLELAKVEAARLAARHPTRTVYILEIVSVIEATVIREPKVIVAPVAKPVVAPNPVEPVKVKTSNTLSLPKKNVTA